MSLSKLIYKSLTSLSHTLLIEEHTNNIWRGLGSLWIFALNFLFLFLSLLSFFLSPLFFLSFFPSFSLFLLFFLSHVTSHFIHIYKLIHVFIFIITYINECLSLRFFFSFLLIFSHLIFFFSFLLIFSSYLLISSCSSFFFYIFFTYTYLIKFKLIFFYLIFFNIYIYICIFY